MKKTPALLVIMDGFGLASGNPESLSDHPSNSRSDGASNGENGENHDDSRFDAIRAAKTPCLDRLQREYALTALSASGNDVGFPAGQPGRAAAGCMNIGAGRIVYQDLVRISRAVADGSFYQNPVFIQAMNDCLTHSSALHLIGVLSDTGSYSHIGHLFALLKMAVEFNLKHIYLHLILEGRDERGLAICRELLRRLTEHIHELNAEEKIRIATLMGLSRVTGNVDALESAYDAMVYGESDERNLNSENIFNILSDLKVCEDLEPVICAPDCSISDHDALIFWSFRPLKNLARAFADPDFELFTRQIFPLTRVSFSDYQVPGVSVAFPNPVIRNTIGEYLSALGLTQLRIAKASRFDEIGYYLNGCAAGIFPGEDRISEFSSASEIGSACIRRMESGAYDLIILGLPDCEEAILTGSPERVTQAVETIDACIGAVADAALKMGGIVIVTASCGGAESLNLSDSRLIRDHDGTTNPVPFLLCGAGSKLRSGGRLSDIAPTLLDLMGLACPDEMDGKTLIVE